MRALMRNIARTRFEQPQKLWGDTHTDCIETTISMVIGFSLRRLESAVNRRYRDLEMVYHLSDPNGVHYDEEGHALYFGGAAQRYGNRFNRPTRTIDGRR